jgi:SAM-dependent methyltransferase
MRDHRPQIVAQRSYLEHRGRLESMQGLQDKFAYIYEANLWGSDESYSGVGSTLRETEVLRRELPSVLAMVKASSLLDIPCGDFRWMSRTELPGTVVYIGADIVPTIVTCNQERFSSCTRKFVALDVTADPLPRADVVLCRDCLVHLSYANVWRAIANIKRSGSKWPLTTNFVRLEANTDICDSDWRPLNFLLEPFCFPALHRTILEGCLEGDGAFADKALCLWHVPELPES